MHDEMDVYYTSKAASRFLFCSFVIERKHHEIHEDAVKMQTRKREMPLNFNSQTAALQSNRTVQR